jgi:hypothetical protein
MGKPSHLGGSSRATGSLSTITDDLLRKNSRNSDAETGSPSLSTALGILAGIMGFTTPFQPLICPFHNSKGMTTAIKLGLSPITVRILRRAEQQPQTSFWERARSG